MGNADAPEIILVLATLKSLNMILRGLMETGIVVALSYWGFHTGNTLSAKIVLGVGAPVLCFGFWGLVDFRHSGSLAEALRLFQELAVSVLASVAWYVAGQHALGWALGLISVVHHVLVYLLGETLLPKTEPGVSNE